MRTGLLVLIISLSAVSGFAQVEGRSEEKPIIENVDVSGVQENRLTSDLRDAMQALVGQRFDQLEADEVGFQIQKEVSQRISAIRQLPGSMPGYVKLLFEFGNAPAPENREPGRHIRIQLGDNVNSRYTVESVEIRGVPDSLVSDHLREDMKKLVGEKLDENGAAKIERRLRQELKPGHTVSRRVERGSDRDHIRLIYEAEKAPLFDFRKFGDYLVGQSKQGLSYGLGLDFEHRNNRFSLGLLDDGDALIERDEGYRLGFENTKTGTEHLGFRIEYFDYNLKWKSQTEDALKSNPEIPGIYRQRRGVEPTLTFALDHRFRLNAGVSVTSLQIQYPESHFQNANALTATATFEAESADKASNDHRLSLIYTIHSASRTLDTDFVYTRHLGDVRYAVNAHRSEFLATVTAGLLTGNAPLFERFSLGNTSTLRGWNKYDLAPIGGNRMAYGSLEYRYTMLQVYYDLGSVWDRSTPHQVSHAIGFGLHNRDKKESWFLTLGVPIRSGHVQPLKPVYMIGGRF